MTLYNEDPSMDFIHIQPDGRYGSKILTSTGDPNSTIPFIITSEI